MWRDRSGKQLGIVGGPETTVANPALSPDGQRLALSRIIERIDKTVTPSHTLRPQYVVSSDGQRFLMNELAGSVDPFSISVILNWKGPHW